MFFGKQKFEVRQLKMNKFRFDVKQLKINKLIKSIWQLIIRISNPLLEVYLRHLNYTPDVTSPFNREINYTCTG